MLQFHQILPADGDIAGKTFKLTSPLPYVRVTLIRFRFTTDANVASRIVEARIQEDDVEVGARFLPMPGEVAQTASQAIVYVYAPNTQQTNNFAGALSVATYFPIPAMIFRAGAVVDFQVTNGQAGDAFDSAIIQYASGQAEELLQF